MSRNATAPDGFPIHRIREERDRLRRQRDGIEKIESCLEQGTAIPLDYDFGGMLGREWQPRLAELPAQLCGRLVDRVIPAMETCCRHPDATADLRAYECSAVSQIRGAGADCDKMRKTVEKVCTHRPTRRAQLEAVGAARRLLGGVILVLDDFVRVSIQSRGSG